MFSVIIPTYNRLESLKKALNSVFIQSYNNYEIIVIDDGSSDGTKEYIASLHNENILYYWQENSGLPSVARNTGIRLSKGDWIAFLDSDDFWYKDKLLEVYNKIQNIKNKNIVAISHWEDMVIDGSIVKILKHGTKSKANMYKKLLFKGNSFSTSAICVRKDVLSSVGLFDTRKEYFIVEDYELWLRLANIGSFINIRKVLGAYCINGNKNNISKDIERTNENLKNVIVNHINNLNINDKFKKKILKKHIARIDYYKGRSYQINGDFQKAISALRISIKNYPFSFKKWISLFFAINKIKK